MGESESKQENGFELPFSVDEILHNNSKHKIHRKPLLNAENMIKKGKYKSALEIYLRTISKFPEPDIREKIEKIIYELESFLQNESTYTKKAKYHAVQSNLVEEKDFNSALKELSDDLTRSLQEGLENLDSIHSELPKELEISPSESEIKEDVGQTEKKSETQPILIIADSSSPSSTELKLDYSNEIASKELSEKTLQNLERVVDILSDVKIPAEKISSLQASKPNTQKFDVVVTTEKEKSSLENLALSDAEFQNLLNKLNLGLSQGLPAADWVPKQDLEEPKSYPHQTRSPVDILAELYHTEEWKPFRHLPLVDRRSGKDRRTKNIPVTKERRSGVERRKVDLFKQRESFLRDWSAQIQNKFPFIGSSAAGLGFQDKLSSYHPSDFEFLQMPENLKQGEFVPSYVPIGLPSGISSRLQDQPPAIDQNSVNQASPISQISQPLTTLSDSIPANREYVQEIAPPSPYQAELVKIGLPDPLTVHLEDFADAPKRNISWELPVEGALQKVLEREPTRQITEKEWEELKGLTTQKVLFPTIKEETIHELFKIELPEPIDTKVGKTDDIFGTPGAMPRVFEDTPPPDVEIVESDTPPPEQEVEIPAIETPEKEPEPERMIHGVLELKPPEVDDAPFLTLTYDFSKIPHSFRLSKNYSLMEYSYYKYKPMLMKAQEFARRKMLKNALNYYRVIKSQNIPPELKKMINRNILDITEFLEKYLMSKGG